MKSFVLQYFYEQCPGSNKLKTIVVNAEDVVQAMKVCMNIKDCYEIYSVTSK